MVRLELNRIEVGPWPMNCYLLRCPQTGEMAIIDPGADSETILDTAGSGIVACILLTHGHPDHIGALQDLREATAALVGVHRADAEAGGIQADFYLRDGATIPVGHGLAEIVHAPGHTPGSCLLRIEGRALVGDAIFPGGPGHTGSAAALDASLTSLARTVFTWPDEIELFPGHGTHTKVGAERTGFEAFVAAERSPELYGDVTWEQRG